VIVNKLVDGVDSLLKANKVEVIKGQAELIDPSTVRANGQEFSGRKILLAAVLKQSGCPFPASNCPGWLPARNCWIWNKFQRAW
jgi:dihydrolipoamide dehydrogenase